MKSDIGNNHASDLSYTNDSNQIDTLLDNMDNNCNNGSSMVSISSETYEKLLHDSMELIKANEKIEKLTAKIEMKDQLIEILKKEQDNAHLTPVSRFITRLLDFLGSNISKQYQY